MTRKTCTNHPHVDIVLQSVCHELNSFDCYGQSKNVKSRRHKQDISPNLLNLRHLYRTDPAVALFLKINGIDLSENWSDQKFCSMTRNRMTRSQTNSVCCKAKTAPGGEYAHRLRTRRHTVFTSNFADTSGDDDSNHIKPMRELRSSSRLALALVKSVEREERSTRPRRNLKPKRISADERLVVDNKSYYKVELLTNKLRSSAVYNRELDGARLKKSKSPPTECDDSDDDKVTFTTKKIRDYELIRLNNEAENFLFPNKEETTSEDEVESNKKVEVTPVTHHRSFKNVKCEPEEESSMDSIFSDTSTSRKKRRLTQAESFILDNQKYYKFETPGSRLRYQGSYLAPVPPKNNGEHGSAKSKCKESKDKGKEKEKESKGVDEDQEQIKFNLEDVKFSFELVPNKEPWYETFQRQDVAEECYSCYNYNTGFYKPFLMPYEMGPLPPLDPNYCMYEYNLVRQPLINSESQIHNDDSSSNDTLKIDECSSSYEDTKSSDDTLNSELTLNELFSSNNNIKRTYRRRLFNNSRNPRKSPRQHASTLAILSSFIHQRKRREIHKQQAAAAAAASPATPKPEEKLDLSVISEGEAEEKKEEPPVDYDSIFNDIDEMLTNNYEELDDDDLISQEDGFEFDVHCALDPVEMLEDCIKCKHKEEVLKDATKESLSKTAKSGKLLTTGRKTGRKRKKNRTGWPNKNKRVLFRKDDNVANNAARNKVNHAKQLEKLLEEIKTNDDELNGNVEPIKINGCTDLKNLLTTTPKRKENRVSSSENCAEVVIASMNDKLDCVNVDLDKWENAERVLSAKLRTESINNDIQFQPIVRVQKLDTDVSKLLQNNVVTTTTPARKSTKKSRRMPASPKSPKMFRKPRGACYRERYSERIHYN